MKIENKEIFIPGPSGRLQGKYFKNHKKIKKKIDVFNYLKNKPMSPKKEKWDKALEYWSKLNTDTGANFDKEINLDGKEIILKY